MKTLIILCFMLFLFFSIINAQGVVDVNKIETGRYLISIDQKAYEEYGGQYPLTYKFSLPHGSENLIVSKKYQDQSEYEVIDEKQQTDYFNAVEAVRFDYENNTAFVSVAFISKSNFIELKFQNSWGEVDAEYVEICEYYDNRHAVVTATIDDYASWFKDWAYESVRAFQQHKIWITMGVITEGSYTGGTWESIQELLDSGYCEAASHSRNHLHIQDYNYDYEIIGSRDDIFKELDLPDLFKNGDKEYVYTWIAPFGEHNEISDVMFGEAKYLVNRLYTDGDYELAEWDSLNMLFKPFGVSGEIGNTSWPSSATEDTLKLTQRFDDAYNNGGVYHLVLHPQSISWEKRYAWSHLEYIEGRNDIWYTSLGHLYLYQFLRDGSYFITDIPEEEEVLPTEISLSQNYPNPFNPLTTINYSIADDGFVSLKVYNSLGEEIKTVIGEYKGAGSYSVQFSAADLSSGVYFYRLSQNNISIIKKMILLK